MSVDNYGREILFRRVEGKIIKERYAEKIEALTGSSFDESKRLSLEDTDKLIDPEAVLVTAVALPSFADCLERLESEGGGGNYYLLLDGDWKYCGAYVVNIGGLNGSYNFYGTLSSEVRFISMGADYEVWIDFVLDNKGDYFEYERHKRRTA